MPASDPIHATGSPKGYTARVEPSGPSFEAPGSQTLLQSAQEAGLLLSSSCRNGTCRTCICLLTHGQVVYRIEWPGVSAEEKREGYILPCVAYPASDLAFQLPL